MSARIGIDEPLLAGGEGGGGGGGGEATWDAEEAAGTDAMRLDGADDPDEDEELARVIQPKSSLGTTTFNLVNNMVGSGLLSIPWCMHELKGATSGTAFLALLATVSWSSFALIGLVCSRYKNVKTFDELAALAGISQKGTKVLLALYTWLSCISYVLLTCDFVAGESGLGHFDWSCSRSSKCSWLIAPFKHRMGVVVFLILFVLYPFSQFKDFSSLKTISYFSFFAMICMMAVAAYEYATVESTPSEDEKLYMMLYHNDPGERTNWLKGIFLAHPIFLISFTAQYNAPRLFAELENASSYRFAVACALATFISFAIYAAFGIISYETFLDLTKSNVLMNYSGESKLAVFARFAMTIVVLTTYPLAYQAMKAALSVFLEGFRYTEYVDYPLVVATALPAVFMKDIGVVLDYKGAVLGGVVALLIPSLALIRVLGVSPAESDHEDNVPPPIARRDRWGWYARWARVLIVWSAVASIGGFITTTLHLMGEI